jgi:hypothetical protein
LPPNGIDNSNEELRTKLFNDLSYLINIVIYNVGDIPTVCVADGIEKKCYCSKANQCSHSETMTFKEFLNFIDNK